MSAGPPPGAPPADSQRQGPAAPAAAPPGDRGWIKAVIDESRKKIVGIVVALLLFPLTWLSDRLLGAGWQGALVVAPVAVAALVFWKRAPKQGGFRLEGPYLWFFLAYVLAFSVAAATDLLVWNRTPMVGLEDAAPRTWLGLSRLGDWRYRVTPRTAPRQDLIIVTLPPSDSLDPGRTDLMRLIAVARRAGAKAVALDLRLLDPSPVDERICRQVVAAAEPPAMPVLVGYGFHRLRGNLVRDSLAPGLVRCLPLDSSQGHLVVYKDGDGRVRFLPADFRGVEGFPALSVRVASLMVPPDRSIAPASELLQPIPAAAPYQELQYQTLTDAEVPLLRDRVVLVGEDSPAETFLTPWGRQLGVQLHAQAVHSLVSGRAYQRMTRWAPSLLALLAGGFALTVLASKGGGRGRILAAALVMSAAWVAVAILAASRRVWLEVIYPVTGICLLALLFSVRIRRSAEGTGT